MDKSGFTDILKAIRALSEQRLNIMRGQALIEELKFGVVATSIIAGQGDEGYTLSHTDVLVTKSERFKTLYKSLDESLENLEAYSREIERVYSGIVKVYFSVDQYEEWRFSGLLRAVPETSKVNKLMDELKNTVLETQGYLEKFAGSHCDEKKAPACL